jgi:hypothetical protein
MINKILHWYLKLSNEILLYYYIKKIMVPIESLILSYLYNIPIFFSAKIAIQIILFNC